MKKGNEMKVWCPCFKEWVIRCVCMKDGSNRKSKDDGLKAALKKPAE